MFTFLSRRVHLVMLYERVIIKHHLTQEILV